MTKEQFLDKWMFGSNSLFEADLEAVIATEIKKAKVQPQPEIPSSQAKLDNSFDKERFEAMFRAVVASGEGNLWSSVFDITNQALKQLDAYYASKEGGGNG